jgi:hypothetical protein
MKLGAHRFQVTGIFPLLTHNPKAMGAASAGPKIRKIPTPEEEALAGCYRDAKGNFCIPAVAFRSSLLNSLKNKKFGKSSAISVMQAAVFNHPASELAVLCDPDTGKPLTKYEIDTRRAIIQRNGVMRSRPRFESWACEITLVIDGDSVVSPEMIEEHLNIAGQSIGVGDFRIERRGFFGAFKVELVK